MLNYGSGTKNYKSLTGACFTLFVVVLTLIFSTQLILTLLQRNGTIFTQSLILDYYDDMDSFGVEDGFRFAFAIIDANTEDYSDFQGREFADYIEISA